MMKARVIYNEETDQFEVQYQNGEKWVTETSYNCVASNKKPMSDANFISWTILRELAKLEYLGYKISFKKLL